MNQESQAVLLAQFSISLKVLKDENDGGGTKDRQTDKRDRLLVVVVKRRKRISKHIDTYGVLL